MADTPDYQGFPALEFEREPQLFAVLGNHLRVTLPALSPGERGVMTGFALPPAMHAGDAITGRGAADARLFRSDSPHYRAAAGALRAVAKGATALAATGQDTRLSDEGRAEVHRQTLGVMLDAMAQPYTTLKRMEGELASTRAQLFAAPAADAMSAPVDVELRTWFRGLETDEQIGALRNNPRLLEALVRSPLPLDKPVQEQRDAAWAEHVERQKPAEVSALKRDEAANEWGRGFLELLARTFVSPDDGKAPPISRFDSFRVLSAAKAESLLRFTPFEAEDFGRRIAALGK